MKTQILIGIICLVAFSQCHFYDKLLNVINKEAVDMPGNAGTYIRKLNGYVDVLANTIKKDKVARLVDIGVPKHAVDHFVNSIQFASENSFTYSNVNLNSIVYGIGTIELQGENARYAYLESHISGETITQKENRPIKKCKKRFLRKKKCWWEDNWVDRGFTSAEIQVIQTALKAKTIEYLRNKVIALKNLSPNTSFIMEMQTVPN